MKTFTLLLTLPLLLFAQSYKATTIAGFGTFGGDAGRASEALLAPGALTMTTDGTIYVSDPVNFRIRKIDPAGTITSVIGKGYSGFVGDGGTASSAEMTTSTALTVDGSGNLFFTDDGNNRVREVMSTGIVKTIAGNGTCGVATAGIVATNAPLCDVEGIALDAQNRVYFGSSDQIWMIGTDGKLVLIAGINGGTGNQGDGGSATSAQIGFPSSIVVDQTGNLYFADTYNFVIRKITPDQRINAITKITDSGASTISLALDASGALYYVTGTRNIYKFAGSPTTVATIAAPNTADYVVLDKTGIPYVSSIYSERVLQVANNVTTPIAGAYPYGSDQLPVPANTVRLHLLSVDAGIALDAAGNVYFPELDNNLLQRIDKVTPSGTMTALNTPTKLPNGISFTADALAFSPTGTLHFSTFSQVYKLDSNGNAVLVAGANGFPANLGDGGPAVDAKVTSPVGLAFDAGGNLYIAEAFSGRVRKVTPQGIISTFAGTGDRGYSGDNGPANRAQLSALTDVKVDGQGNVYIADVSAAVVRKVDISGNITTVAGNGTHGFSGDGGPATKAMLSGAGWIAVDPAGNLFISDRSQAGGTFVATPDNNRIRMVNTAGVISTIAGPTSGYNGEGAQTPSIAVGGPTALATDAQGNLYVGETNTERVRKFVPVAPASSVVISSVATAYGNPEISQNAYIEIKGVNLAPSSVGSGVIWSDAPEFLQGKMPTQLRTVSVMVNGKAAFIYFVSPGQINALTPLDNTTGNLSVVVTNGTTPSAPFTVNARTATPSFLRIGATNYITGQHSDFSLLGPASISVPGYTFTPAKPGETVVLYAVGFGLPNAALVNGSSSQFGALLALPVVKIAGINANVQFAGINGAPGLYQLNVDIPQAVSDGDAQVTVSYGGVTTPLATIAVAH